MSSKQDNVCYIEILNELFECFHSLKDYEREILLPIIINIINREKENAYSRGYDSALKRMKENLDNK